MRPREAAAHAAAEIHPEDEGWWDAGTRADKADVIERAIRAAAAPLVAALRATSDDLGMWHKKFGYPTDEGLLAEAAAALAAWEEDA